MLFIIFLILAISNCIRCSEVVDAVNQRGIYIQDYCPKMEYCPEGAHTMCLYYNPNKVMGPRCKNAVPNITITPEMANKVLDVTNAARGKLAQGKEKGQKGTRLPRGYGIFRLKWDSELATIAQVLANQCVLRHDLCRATKRFPDPGQTAGLVRFYVSNWMPISKSGNFSKDGLDEEKLQYAVIQSLKSWYTQKSFITAEMITNYPDWTKDPNKQSGRLYLEMVYGAATHMGCGMSAYTEYVYSERENNNFNSIQVICNFSARPRTGTSVFTLVPPKDSSCGCPPGTVEDDDCLCNEIEKEPESPLQLSHKTDACPRGTNCVPTVVVLPIFTVEDAPPDKLITRQKLANTSFGRALAHTELIDSFEELFYNNSPENRKSLFESGKNKNLAPVFTPSTNISRPLGQKQRPTFRNTKDVTIRVRHYDRKNDEPYTPNYEKVQKQREDAIARKNMPNRGMRPSVFAKTPRFKLPGSHHFYESIKKDVVPRKDFSTAKKLVNKYLYDKHTVLLPKTFPSSLESIISNTNDIKFEETLHPNKELDSYLHPKLYKRKIKHHEDVRFHDILTTETILNTAEQQIINHKKYLNDLDPPQDLVTLEANTVSEDKDKKFMALLDTLEQEVKHIELRENEKRIFDAKIKKIYGTVVGKSSNALSITENLRTQLSTTERVSVGRFKKGANKTQLKQIRTNKFMSAKQKFTNKLTPPETTTNKSEYDKNIIEHGQLEHDDEFDVSQKYQKLGSNDMGTDKDNFVNIPISKDKNVKIDYDRIDPLQKDSSNTLTNEFAKESILTDKKVQENYERRNPPKNDFDDIVTEERRGMSFIRENKINERRMNRNKIDSFETAPYRYGNGYKRRQTYKNENFGRNVIGKNDNNIFKHRSNSLDYRSQRNNYYDNNANKGLLSADRRKYYQEKLDSVERKLQRTGHRNRKNEVERPRHLRTMLSNSRSDNAMRPLYTSGWARFLHGY